jgi:uncharacterized membrane protein
LLLFFILRHVFLDDGVIFFVIVFAGVFLRERLTWQQAVGATLIVAGSFIIARGR